MSAFLTHRRNVTFRPGLDREAAHSWNMSRSHRCKPFYIRIFVSLMKTKDKVLEFKEFSLILKYYAVELKEETAVERKSLVQGQLFEMFH